MIFYFFELFFGILKEFLKITNNKNIGAASKIGAGGDEKHVIFVTWPNCLQTEKYIPLFKKKH